MQQRSIQLPPDADMEFIKARYENGVLAISIPKYEKHVPAQRDIDIED